jgi:hypothetical protein
LLLRNLVFEDLCIVEKNVGLDVRGFEGCRTAHHPCITIWIVLLVQPLKEEPRMKGRETPQINLWKAVLFFYCVCERDVIRGKNTFGVHWLKKKLEV